MLTYSQSLWPLLYIMTAAASGIFPGEADTAPQMAAKTDGWAGAPAGATDSATDSGQWWRFGASY